MVVIVWSLIGHCISRAMAALLVLVLLATVASGSYIRLPRATSGSGSGAGAFSGASSSSFSSSGTKVAPGLGGYGNFNAFAGTSNYGAPPAGADQLYKGGDNGGVNQFGQPPFGQSPFGQSPYGQSPFGFPTFTPFVPQYGQPYPYTPFPTFAAPFDFMSFLNQYFQSLQNFQSQADVQAQQAAASGHGIYRKGPGYTVWSYSYPRSQFFPLGSGAPLDSNEVGGVSMVSYGPQGGYGSANVFPKPEGGLESRFGADDGAPDNSVGPVGSVSGNFQPPSGGSFGVFSSSSSGSSDINGKKTSFKQSSIGINDNGKVTTYTAHDP